MDELSKYKLVLTYEDHDMDTGMGSKLAIAFACSGKSTKLLRKGVTQYGTSGKPDELYRAAGLMPDQIADSILGSGLAF